jgi:hypothetical protein
MTLHQLSTPTGSVEDPEHTPNRLGRFVQKHPLLTLMLVFNTFGQALVFVPVVLKRTHGTNLNLEVFQSISLILFLLLPALAITRFVHGPEALRRLMQGAVRFRVPLRWYLVPLALVPAGGVVFALSFRDGQSRQTCCPRT